MRQGMAWYKRYPRAFLDGVQGLGPELIGAYAVLLDLLYARGGESTRDDRHLGGILGCSTRKAKALTDTLIELGKIHSHDGFITNPRALQQSKQTRTKREANVKRARDGGIKSGEVRKNKALAEANASSENEVDKSRVDKKDTLANANGGSPPDSLQLLAKQVYDEGKALVVKLRGVSDGTAGGYVTAWLSASQNNHVKVLKAIRDAAQQSPPPVDIRSWVMGIVSVTNEPKWKRDNISAAEEFQNA